MHQEVAAVLSLFILLISLNNKKEYYFSIPLVGSFVIAWIPIIQFAIGVLLYFGDAIESFIYFFLFGLSVFIGSNIRDNSNNSIDFCKILSIVFIIGSLVSFLIAMLQWTGLANGVDISWIMPIRGSRPYANLGQPNNLATLFGFGLAGVFYLFEQNKIRNYFALILALLLIFGLALTQSRTPWVVAAILPFFWLWQSHRMPLRTTARHVLLLVGVYVGFVLMLPVLGSFLEAPVSSVLERATQAHRWDMYKQALYFIAHGPWYGFGWGQIPLAHSLLSAQAPEAIFYHYSHNIVLDILLWNGPWIGGIIVVLFSAWLGTLFFQKNTVKSLFAWLGLLFFLIHSMLEYPYAYLFLLLPAGLLLGIVEGQHRSREFEISAPKNSIAIIAIIGLAVTVAFWNNYLIIESDYREATRKMEENFIPEEVQAVSQAILLDELKETVYFSRFPLKSGYSEDLLERVDVFANRFPRKFSLVKSCYIFSLNGRQEKAITQLIKLKDIFGISALEEALSYLYQESEKTPELLPVLAHFGLVKKAPAAVSD
ncbi:O-antigen ligase family protein [Comamonas nitrativorans]